MAWHDSAQTLLDTASGAALSTPLARKLVAAGPIFARDCRQVVVYLASIDASPLPTGDLPGGSCVVVPSLNLVVAFHADCYPVANDHGKPPPEDDVTAWTLTWLADIESIWNAVADAALAGTLGECSGVTIGEAQIAGPLGAGAEVTIPVRLLSL